MRHGLASSLLLLVACSSVKTADDDGGGGVVDGGADASPDAAPNVTEELIGIWDLEADGEATGCTATFTDGILVECINDPQTTSEPSCLRQSTLHITGSWFAGLELELEETEDYSGTCTDASFVDNTQVFATMTGMRIAAGSGTGLWQAASGQWRVVAVDPMLPEDGEQITCTATFTPAADHASVDVTCETPWDDTDADGCENRATYHITSNYTPGTVTVDFTGQSEKMGVTCIEPLIDIWDPSQLIATKR
jgi:hypothetical protein